MSHYLTATYKPCSYWELEFNLNDVAEWYVKWDTLHVKFKDSDTEFTEFEPTSSAEDDHEGFKTPNETYFE